MYHMWQDLSKQVQQMGGFGADPWRVLRILTRGDVGKGILIQEKYVNQSVEVRKNLCSDKIMRST